RWLAASSPSEREEVGLRRGRSSGLACTLRRPPSRKGARSTWKRYWMMSTGTNTGAGTAAAIAVLMMPVLVTAWPEVTDTNGRERSARRWKPCGEWPRLVWMGEQTSHSRSATWTLMVCAKRE
ncbi:unnamed protein product, partial [Ectocarpus sp. 8 AP-2014]